MPDKTIFTTVMPPRIEDVKIYFSQKGMPDREAEAFFLFHDTKLWRNRKGDLLKSWKKIAYKWILSAWRLNPLLFDKKIL